MYYVVVYSYVPFTPPVGWSNKLLTRNQEPFQVMDKIDSIYIIEDLVSGKWIMTHMGSQEDSRLLRPEDTYLPASERIIDCNIRT